MTVDNLIWLVIGCVIGVCVTLGGGGLGVRVVRLEVR